jgi:hypothetical protein
VILRMKVKDISRSGRTTRGGKLIQLQPGNVVASMARMAEAELRRQETAAG